MSPRLKWGLITGGVVALLNLCGGTLLGAFNNCFSIVTVAIAAVVAGYFCAHQEPAEEAIKAGGIAGAIVGAMNLVSQLIGGILGGLIGLGILAAFTPQAKADPSSFSMGAGLGIGIIVIAAIVTGIILILGGAGIGALTAKLAMPKTETVKEIKNDFN
ncbi:MAG: hypothetical protein NTW32_17105 [Chloroflexi bacterium]|nr:hypothetical protein [Chloroflexota bacterium]